LELTQTDKFHFVELKLNKNSVKAVMSMVIFISAFFVNELTLQSRQKNCTIFPVRGFNMTDRNQIKIENEIESF
jgi:hypothetical protein